MPKPKVFNVEDALDKAIELFWHKGYNGTSAQDLVAHLGISRSSIYDTFVDKRTLFVLALERYQKQSLLKLIDLFDAADSIKDAFKKIFEQAVSESLEDERFTKGCFVVNTSIELALHDKEIAKIVNESRQLTEELFLSAIRRGQNQGEISKLNDARELARFLYNNYLGIRVLARSAITDRQVFDDVVKVISGIM
jgi:TetR/AcrR family transcriptional repressor of nem operon